MLNEIGFDWAKSTSQVQIPSGCFNPLIVILMELVSSGWRYEVAGWRYKLGAEVKLGLEAASLAPAASGGVVNTLSRLECTIPTPSTSDLPDPIHQSNHIKCLKYNIKHPLFVVNTFIVGWG